MSKIKQAFTDIYVNRKWDSGQLTDDSVSGPGSSIAHTVNIRAELPELFKTFGITRVFDAGCGDLNWMSRVLQDSPDVEYTGGDIVDELIEQNQKAYPEHTFVTVDITRDALPSADLMICRECLFHLSDSDIKLALNNFLQSDIAAILMTSDLVDDANRDIESGDFRWVNFFNTPWNFTKDYIYTINDWPYQSQPQRKMFMWSQEQIKNIVDKYNNT
jgi:hypothetical protein